MNKLLSFLFRRSQCEYAVEFCPRCDANLTLQRGYRNDLPYWECKGCGEMLINPNIDTETNIVWLCDECGAMLNVQKGFQEDCGEWECTKCGFANALEERTIYLSEDEYRMSLQNPYKGMKDEDVLSLLCYEEIESVGGNQDVILICDRTGKMYIKKQLTIFDANVYESLREHPIAHMPQIYGIYQGSRYLVVVEEYIEGMTLADCLQQERMSVYTAVRIARDLLRILIDLHTRDVPIIHRDIKPSNVMLGNNDEVFLLDVNVAKKYVPDQLEDTKLLGTLYYAAPEQVGFGHGASTPKTDIYALGVLLNVLITGKLPKEEKAKGEVWVIVDRCIKLDPEERYSDEELLSVLNTYLGKGV